MRTRLTHVAAGAVYLAIVWVLGAFVSHAAPRAFDRSGAVFFDQAQPLAIFASESGLFNVYFGIGAAALIAGIARRAFLGRALFLIAALFVTWRTGDALKLFFARPRPHHWLWVYEKSSSYTSGHAALAVAGYGLLAAYVWRSGLPVRERSVIAGALLLWILTIDWSRLALGAHYPTDLIGGTLLGLGVVSLGRAVYDPFASAGRIRRKAGSRLRAA